MAAAAKIHEEMRKAEQAQAQKQAAMKAQQDADRAASIARQRSTTPRGSGLKILFLHGYGMSPELSDTIGALDGLKNTLPGARITPLAGFVTIDFEHPPTAATFADPPNNLSDVRKYSEQTKQPLYAWANFSEPSASDEPRVQQRGYKREDAATQSAVAEQLIKHMDDDPAGGYDMLVGFSQGGEIGMLVAARLSSGHYRAPKGGRMPTKFLLLGSELGVVFDNFNSATPAEDLPPLHWGAAAESERTGTPLEVKVAVVAGEKDVDASGSMESWASELRERGLRHVTTFRWSGDHRMPPKGEKVYNEVVEMLQV